ncbi:MAG: cytochrome C oxidase subunit IV family protein [Chlamydiia bacterium]|nr:cytochrome C oxidase subunit IV family protein [Chlamydiia bacterium]
MELEQKCNTSMRPLIWGLIISVVLLLGMYVFAQVPYLVIALTVLQAVAVLVYFMHLGFEEKPRWNLLVFLAMVVLIIAVVAGSIWIMYNLDYNIMMK